MQNFQPAISRRALLNRLCSGFGGLALNSLLHQTRIEGLGLQKAQLSHWAPRAKRVIFLFMHGGPSHIDLFDYKPRLQRESGNPLPFGERSVQFAARGNLMGSPWEFQQVGASGLWMSKLWKHLPKVADDLCMIHSLCETNVAHGGACMKLHTGDEAFLRPSMGSWISYGLGSENQNLPSFITICPTSLHGGVNNFGSAFLPATHQGVPLGTPGYPNTLAKNAQFQYMKSSHQSPEQQRLQIKLLRKMHRERSVVDPVLEARIQSYELAFRMQTEAPEATDLKQESKATRQLYGLDDPETNNFGTLCLQARRLTERGVRFIQVSHAHTLPFNNEQWDQHSHLEKGHQINVKQIDRPITGLIQDLKKRGLLEDTLVLWGGEFGRLPLSQKSQKPGRDHNPHCFTTWMAGGGIKAGYDYGQTDEFAYNVVENPVHIRDLNATILHQLGIDHERFTFKFRGLSQRLTGVEEAHVVNDILS